MEFNPAPDATMRAGDYLVVLGQPRTCGSWKRSRAGRARERDTRRRIGPADVDRVRRCDRSEMSARLLDGQAVAAAIRESVLPDVHAFTARPAGRRVSASCSSATIPGPRSTSATRSARARSPASGSTCSGCRRRRRSTICWRSCSELNDSERHDGILVQSPLPAAMGKGAAQQVFDAIDPAKDVDGFHPDQRRPARAGTRAACAVHAVRRHRDARPDGHRDRGRARRRHRPQRDRRQADGDAAAASRRDRHDLPLEDAGPAGASAPRPTSSWRRSAAPGSSRRTS